MKTYVSIDPGATVGVATWDEQGHCIHKCKWPIDIFDRFLEGLVNHETPDEIQAFIVEEYRVYGHKAMAHIGSKVETAQCIGKVKMVAKMLKVPVIEQRASILRIAAKWAGVKIPGGHIPDDVSAYLHGYYYLHQRGIIPARVLEDG